jgi:hypothetical protein
MARWRCAVFPSWLCLWVWRRRYLHSNGLQDPFCYTVVDAISTVCLFTRWSHVRTSFTSAFPACRFTQRQFNTNDVSGMDAPDVCQGV